MNSEDQWSDYALYSPGRYKMFENFTQRASGKVHSYMHPDRVEREMKNLVSKVNLEIRKIGIESIENHPLAITTRFHQVFLNEIHPFADGNGRIGRIFMNLIIMKTGFPPIFIKEVDKAAYLACFEDHDPSSMLNFIADRMLESLKMKLEFIDNQESA